MFFLPRTLSSDVRALLEKDLEDLPLEKITSKVTRSVLELFEAKDCFFFLYRFSDDGREAFSPQVATQDPTNLEALKELSARWKNSGIDDKILHDFRSKVNCVSYSAFAWPYGSLSTEAPAGKGLAIPRDFTLLLPVNSQLSVSHQSDCGFLGYFALFFDSFPQLADRTIQLITTLPQILSDVILAYFRQSAGDEANELGTFAHEVKRQLLFAAEMLERSTGQPRENEDYVSAALRTLHRLIQRTSAVLLADRINAGGLRISRLPICLNEVVEEVAQNFRGQLRKRNTQMIIELDEDLPLSPIDPSVFPTVIENLIENSLRYSGPNSCIYLRTRRSEDSQVVLEVLDDGKAIPENEWEKIFQKHYRVDSQDGPDGNGLGLYLVQKIVEAHEGRIYPRKCEEMKTCFVIELPTMEQI